jgi:[ribosomal protein S18]-alanine N-acetyltransferase
MFADELACAGTCAEVAVNGEDRVVGFLVCRLYGDWWHVMDLAVEPPLRGRGVAAGLLDWFLRLVAGQGTDVTLEVRPANVAAIALYQSRGFALAGVRRRYYVDTGEDAVIMTLSAGVSAEGDARAGRGDDGRKL